MTMPPVEERIVALEKSLEAVTEDIGEIKRGVEKLTDKIDGRPSWIVTTLITLLTTACGILATLVATLD